MNSTTTKKKSRRKKLHFLKTHLRENQSLPLKREEAIDQTESLPACQMMLRRHCPFSLRHKGPKLLFFPLLLPYRNTLLRL